MFLFETEIFEQALFIREFENLLLSLFAKGKLNGTVHTCVGQELIPVVLSKFIKKEDTFFSNHRGHGHYLAKTNNSKSLLAEIMGKEEGCSGGYGGSQHLYAEGEFYSNGIQGGMTAVAVGNALSKKSNDSDTISVVFIGDGTLGEGLLYEAMNMASVFQVPVLFVLENNSYAQSTSLQQVFAGNIKGRAEGFGLKYIRTNIWDYEDLHVKCELAIKSARLDCPTFLQIDCYRLNSHSKSDDNRSKTEIAAFWDKDLLTQFARIHPEIADNVKQRVVSELSVVLSKVEDMNTLDHVIKSEDFFKKQIALIPYEEDKRNIRQNEAIYLAIKSLFESNRAGYFIGEDIEGANEYTPEFYGGAFKVSRDLSNLFSGKIRNAPISEAAITGVSIGLALSQKGAIAEIMFGDFTSLIFDQLLQHASKFCTMYGAQVKLPLIVRTPMGGKRGYGPTHSQSIEKHFLGIKNLFVIAINLRIRVDELYTHAINLGYPVLIIENKIDYSSYVSLPKIETHDYYITDDIFPTLVLTPKSIKASLTIVTYGGSLNIVEAAAYEAFIQEEIGVEVICLSSLYPCDTTLIKRSVSGTGKVITVEEGCDFAGWGSQIISELVQDNIKITAGKTIGNREIIPSSFRAEMNLLPSKELVLNYIKTI